MTADRGVAAAVADRGLAQFRGLLAVSPLLGELFARIRNPDVLVGSDRPTVRRGVTEHYWSVPDFIDTDLGCQVG